jgi:probable F420-dependent oxidoreductase
MQLDASIGFDTTLAEIPDLARRAERLGFGALWTAETRHDPFLPLALAAETTSRVALGTAVAVAFARSPAVTAMTAWDLAHRSGGRFILGLGTQVRAHVERRFAMSWSGHPAAQLRDYVGAVRAIWHAWQTGEPIRYRGSHYPISLMTPFFSPPPIEYAAIPIFLAAVGPTMCSLAGEVADGMVVHPVHSVRYLTDVAIPAVIGGAVRAARRRSDVQVSASVLVGLGESGREQVREQIAFYASTPTYRGLLALHGWEETGTRLSELARRGRWAEMPGLVSDEMVDAFAVVGDWDELAHRLQGRYDGLVDRIALYRPFGLEGDEPGWSRLLSAFRAAPGTGTSS